jgi:hypothetical protein
MRYLTRLIGLAALAAVLVLGGHATDNGHGIELVGNPPICC